MTIEHVEVKRTPSDMMCEDVLVTTDHVEVGEWDDGLQFLALPAVLAALQDQLDAARDVLLEEAVKQVTLHRGLAAVTPLLPERHVAEVLRVNVDHPAARDGRWGGVLKVIHLKQRAIL